MAAVVAAVVAAESMYIMTVKYQPSSAIQDSSGISLAMG